MKWRENKCETGQESPWPWVLSVVERIKTSIQRLPRRCCAEAVVFQFRCYGSPSPCHRMWALRRWGCWSWRTSCWTPRMTSTCWPAPPSSTRCRRSGRARSQVRRTHTHARTHARARAHAHAHTAGGKSTPFWVAVTHCWVAVTLTSCSVLRSPQLCLRNRKWIIYLSIYLSSIMLGSWLIVWPNDSMFELVLKQWVHSLAENELDWMYVTGL